MMHYLKGNLLNSNCQYLCHQVNCRGVMNSGIAKVIREKWPIIFEEYKKWYNKCWNIACDEYGWCEDGPDGSDLMLGHCLAVPISENQSVINMAAQHGYGYDGQRYTSYDAFWMCLGEIKQTVPKGSSIGFPDHIGCCRGGANWNIIKAMIEEVLGNDYDIYIYELEN